MKSPNFFIAGAPKCGTTSLASWLAEHPSVFMAPVKEPHFYNSDVGRQITSEHEYRTLFAKAQPRHRAIGEASVLYLYSDNAIPKIQSELPNARFVILLRNPVTMAPALHEEQVFSFNEDVEDFHRAWRLQELRSKGESLPHHCTEPQLLQYGRLCRLGEQVDRLLKQVPLQQCHFILLDDLKTNPRYEWIRLQDFLEVPDDGRTVFPIKNRAKVSYFPQIAYVVELLGKAKKRLVGRAFSPGFLNRISRANRTERNRPPLGQAMRQDVEDYFYDDIRLLASLLGRDLSGWISTGRNLVKQHPSAEEIQA